jgi:hypothetical protein
MTADLETRLRTRSLRARGLLEPFVLPRIDRPQVWNRYLAAIARAREESGARLIPVLGGAGLGKSTLAGAVWDAEHERGLTMLITCAEVSLPAEPTAAAVDLAFGQAVDLNVPLTEACRIAAGGKPSLLLIDTLDLVLTRATVVPLRNFFYDLLAAGVTVLFTCRDFEYDRYFAAHRHHLPDLDRSVDGQFVPPFSMEEVEEATRRFAERAHGPGVAARFARSVVDLAADRRPVREIVKNPLLLAMLCNLYSGGVVPPDLTVAQLYETFWSSHVALVRRPDTPDTAGPRKERICLALASRILDASEDHFVETIPVGDLRNETEDPVGHAAMLELRSEEVIRERATRLSFFHQTFAEFAIARLLTESSHAQRRDDLLQVLQTSREAERLHLWPILRQLLVLVDGDRFRDIAGRMASINLAAFRAVTMAAATRHDGWDLLSGLADTAIVEGSEFLAAYLIALEIAGADRKKDAEPLLLKVIVEGDSRAATLASKLAGALVGGDTSLAPLLDAIDRRAGTDEENFIRNELQASLLDGLADPAPERLRDLREMLPRLTAPARERVMDLHAQEWVELADAEALLAAFRTGELPKTLYRPAARLLGRIVKAKPDTDWLALLSETWNPGWEYARGHAVAALLEQSPDRATAVVRLMFTSSGTTVGACHTALASAPGKDVAVRIASALLADWDLATTRVQLTAAVIQAIAAELPEETRRTFRERMAPLASEEQEKPVIALAALASSAEDEHAVLSVVDRMPDKIAFRILPAVVRAFRAPLGPNALRAALARVEDALPRGIAQNAQVKLVNLLPEPERSEMLTRLASDPRFFDRTRTATAALAVSIAPDVSLNALVPLVARPQQSIRLHVVQALAHAVESGGRLSAEDLETVAAHLRDEPDSAVLQWFFELAMRWIRAEETVPERVLRVCQSVLVPRLPTLRSGAQRQAVVLLKWAASVVAPGTDAFTRVRAMILEVFLRLDFQRFGDGESEGLEMLSHVVRKEPSFGRTLVDAWEQSVANGRPVAPYTLRALVYLLNRTRDRDLYNRMLYNPACPQIVQAMILKHLDM